MKPTIQPTTKQDLAWMKLLDKKTQYILFGGAAGGGKSWMGCEWLMTNCYLYPGTKWFIGRKELKRLMASTYVTWRKVCSFHRIPEQDWKLNGQYNFIEFTNGSRIDLLDVDYQPSDPDFERFGSLEFTGGWIEEAGEVKFKAFDVLKTRVGRHLNSEFKLTPKILLTCNPTKNWLYVIFYKLFKANSLPPEYAFIQALHNDNPYNSEDYKKQLSSITDKALKERLMFGNWEYDSDPSSLMNYNYIVDMFSNSVTYDNERYITADIARYGSDKTVIMLWQGLEVTKIITHRKLSIVESARAIRDLAIRDQVPFSHIIVDEDGVGGGVVDILNGVNGFIANSVAISRDPEAKENYQNLKTQCCYLLADYINRHRISIKTQNENGEYLLEDGVREYIVEELEQIKREDMDKDGKLKVVSKDKIKELIGRSPDYSDNLMMRMWFELNKILVEDPTFIHEVESHRILSINQNE